MTSAALSMNHDPAVVPGSELPPPIVSYRVGACRWRLERDYGCDHEGRRVTIPGGFEFDLASVPRQVWWLVAPFELSIAAPLIHDFLYRCGGAPPPGAVVPEHRYTRREADRLFLRMMEREGVAAWRRRAAYGAVRAFGGLAWKAALPAASCDR
jgi:hypothetical protein